MSRGGDGLKLLFDLSIKSVNAAGKNCGCGDLSGDSVSVVSPAYETARDDTGVDNAEDPGSWWGGCAREGGAGAIPFKTVWVGSTIRHASLCCDETIDDGGYGTAANTDRDAAAVVSLKVTDGERDATKTDVSIVGTCFSGNDKVGAVVSAGRADKERDGSPLERVVIAV